MAKRKRKTELGFNLAAVRKVKRLTKRVLVGLEEMERWLLKLERFDRQAAKPEELAALGEVLDAVAARYPRP